MAHGFDALKKALVDIARKRNGRIASIRTSITEAALYYDVKIDRYKNNAPRENDAHERDLSE